MTTFNIGQLLILLVISGYVQGMSDLLSPILVVMQNELEAFWCFAGWLEKVVSFINYIVSFSPLNFVLLTIFLVSIAKEIHSKKKTIACTMYICELKKNNKF